MADQEKVGASGVYVAIANVMRDVGKDGIGKNRKNAEQKYSFRGIDDIFNALSPLLAKHHLIIVPRVLTRERTERPTKSGGVMFGVVVHVEFTIVCSTDGTCITACTFGEGMDTSDKATNKAMSAAYKYMAMQTFCIPIDGSDGDDETPTVEDDRITEAQAQEIDTLLSATKSNLDAFLKYVKAPSVETIKPKDYSAAVSLLKRKLEKVAS